MTITSDQVKALRDRTGAGVMQCKQALVEADGNVEKEHQEILDAAMARDAVLLGELLGNHYRSTVQVVIDAGLSTLR